MPGTFAQVAHTRSGATYVLLPNTLVRSKGYRIQVWALESSHPDLVKGESITALVLSETGAGGRVISTRLMDVQSGHIGTPELYNLSPFEMQLVRTAAAASLIPLDRKLRSMVGK